MILVVDPHEMIDEMVGDLQEKIVSLWGGRLEKKIRAQPCQEGAGSH